MHAHPSAPSTPATRLLEHPWQSGGCPASPGSSPARSARHLHSHGYYQSITAVAREHGFEDPGRAQPQASTHRPNCDSGPKGATLEYGYNSAGRPWLETVRVDGALVSQYQFDGNGNRTNVQLDRSYAGGGSVSLSGSDIVTDNEDRLTKYGDLTLVYDALGRLVEKRDASVTPVAITKYTWDSLGALRRVELPDGRVIEYLIDAIGRRVGKKVNGAVQRRWIYRDTLRPIAELDAAGNVVARYVYADGVGAEDDAMMSILRRLGALETADFTGGMSSLEAFLSGPLTPEYVVAGTTIYRLLTDHLGTLKMVTEAAMGQTALQRSYDEFGVVLSEIGPEAGNDFVPFGFAGGLYDPASGLVRFGARDYDPSVGRWLSKDPILFEGDGPNLYAYVLNDPINGVDPTGEGPADCVKAIARYLECKEKLDKRIEENECSPTGPDRGHDKAIEQRRNRCEELRRKAFNQCKDPSTWGPLLIGAGIGIGIAIVTGGTAFGVGAGAAAVAF
jgi:RHS repeat-associated protein